MKIDARTLNRRELTERLLTFSLVVPRELNDLGRRRRVRSEGGDDLSAKALYSHCDSGPAEDQSVRIR